LRRDLLNWRVELAGHDVDRWHVEAQTVELPAPDAEYACLRVIHWAHSDAGLPPWRPLIRHSMRFATAEPVAAVVTVATPQGELFDRLAA
jgi:hypothetical protein